MKTSTTTFSAQRKFFTEGVTDAARICIPKKLFLNHMEDLKVTQFVSLPDLGGKFSGECFKEAKYFR